MSRGMGNLIAYPLTFAACVSDDRVLHSNLLASPCLAPGSPHEVILVKRCPTASDGLNLGVHRGSERPDYSGAPRRVPS